MIATPIPGQSIDSASGDAWLVNSVTRKLAGTVVNLVPLQEQPSEIARGLDMSLSDFRIFCVFSGIRTRQPDSAAGVFSGARQMTQMPSRAAAE